MNLHLPRRPLTLGAATLLASAIGAAPAGATGSYPGETLSLAQSGPATVGQAANITASGQQTDVNSYAGGFNLEVFQKDPARDSTCSPSYIGEKNTYATELPYEKYIVVGEWQARTRASTSRSRRTSISRDRRSCARTARGSPTPPRPRS
jgi:hypothetical protein